jgi:hypothetical protein
MTDHYRDQIADLCEWLRDKETARLLYDMARDPTAISFMWRLLSGKADQIDPAIQLEAPRQSKSTRPRPESGG